MAPTAGKKRSSLRAKAAASSKPKPLPLSDPSRKPMPDASTSLDLPLHFSTSKRDKQTIKHASFVSKIEKSSSKTTKRRRPNKKLVANLESLTDALPDIGEAGTADGEGAVEVGQAKIHRKSLKSRPGAMKKKEKLERMERERFNANLVQMSSGSGIADRWAALKNHVKNTVEQKPEFAAKQ